MKPVCHSKYVCVIRESVLGQWGHLTTHLISDHIVWLALSRINSFRTTPKWAPEVISNDIWQNYLWFYTHIAETKEVKKLLIFVRLLLYICSQSLYNSVILQFTSEYYNTINVTFINTNPAYPTPCTFCFFCNYPMSLVLVSVSELYFITIIIRV